MQPYTYIVLIVMIAILAFLAIPVIKEYNDKKRRFPKKQLGTLRRGDAFLFSLSSSQVWRVVRTTSDTVLVNQKMRSDMRYVHKAHRLMPHRKQVYFMRHTIPTPGEECFVEDLKPGDMFTIPAQGSGERWRIVNKGYQFDEMKSINSGLKATCGRLTKVVFIGGAAIREFSKN